MSSIPYYANKAKNKAKTWIEQGGQTLTVSRPGSAVGGAGAPTTQSLSCMPQPLTPEVFGKMNFQGGMNYADAMPHNFIFLGDADVKAGDLISYLGFSFRVYSAVPSMISTVRIILECVGMRE